MPVIRETMIKIIAFILLTITTTVTSAEEKKQAVFTTNKGEIVIELDSKAAPETVKNFKQYINAGFYDGTIFHRTIPGFMIQGGGFTTDLKRKPTQAPIQNEADNGLKNSVGTISMARTSDPHSATSQFFINVNDNQSLDFREKSVRGWGYAVFGTVIEGLELVMSISQQPTSPQGRHRDVPKEAVVIEKAFLR